MADHIDALVESLFPVTMSEILRDLTALDFSFVVPSKVCQTVDILPNLHADISVAERFNVTLRTIRERARSRHLGRTLDGTRWFTEAEILGLMTEGDGRCSNSRNGGAHPTSMRGERFLKVAVDQSLGTGDRRQAEALLARLQNEIFERQTRGSVRTSEGFAAAALRYMEAGGERRFIAPLLLHFDDTSVDQIDQQAIDRAASALCPNGSAGTRNRQVYTPVSAILKFAGVTRDVRRSKAPPGRIRWLREDEAERLIAACSPHLRPLVMFLLFTGARLGEALWLNWRCVDLARGHVSFPNTKNGHPRGVPLHRDLVTELSNLPHRDGGVFRRPDTKPYARPRGDDDISAGSKIKTAFRGAVKRAGLTNFRSHDCRHTWATWHFAKHHDLVALQNLDGWRTLSMVTRYAHANADNYRDGINALPSRSVAAEKETAAETGKLKREKREAF
jgi:integrase